MRLLAGYALLLALGAPLPEKEVPKEAWPVFRGNARQTGVSEAKLPATLEELWKFKTKDAIEGTPVVADGMVFVSSFDEYLYAVNLKTGAQKWKFKAGAMKASPAVDGDLVVVCNLDGKVYGVDASKGAKRWIFETGGEITAAPAIAGKAILIGCYGDDQLYCLNRAGKLQWKFRTEGPVNGTVAVAKGYTFVAGCDSQVRVIDLVKGKEVRGVDLGGQSGASAAVLADLLYVGTMTNQVKAINWKKGSVVWEYEAPIRAQPFYSSAAVTADRVIVGSRDRRLHVINRKTGKQVWTHLTRGNVDSSPVVANGRVYVGSMDRHLYVLGLEKGKQIQKIRLDGPISGSPAIVSNRLLIATQEGTLYCFGKK